MIRCRRSWDPNVAHRRLPRSVFQQPARSKFPHYITAFIFCTFGGDDYCPIGTKTRPSRRCRSWVRTTNTVRFKLREICSGSTPTPRKRMSMTRATRPGSGIEGVCVPFSTTASQLLELKTGLTDSSATSSSPAYAPRASGWLATPQSPIGVSRVASISLRMGATANTTVEPLSAYLACLTTRKKRTMLCPKRRSMLTQIKNYADMSGWLYLSLV